MTTVAVSGGFDPLHLGHLSLFKEARALFGTRLVVIVDSDEFILSKGRRPLMPQRQRAAIVAELAVVDGVVLAEGADACSALESLRPGVYCVGGDHAGMDFPEAETCRRLGVRVEVCPHGGPDVRSSLLLAEWARPRWVNPPVTVDGLVERGGKLLVTRRGAGDGEGMLDLPGGFLEEGETLEGCLRREVMEEVGSRIYNLDYLDSQTARTHDGRQIVNVVFRCDPINEPQTSPEAAEILWCDEMPPGEWFSDCCRKAAEGWFRGRGHV